MALLESYHSAKGAIQSSSARDVPVEQLVEMLASNGINLPPNFQVRRPHLCPTRYARLPVKTTGCCTNSASPAKRDMYRGEVLRL